MILTGKNRSRLTIILVKISQIFDLISRRPPPASDEESRFCDAHDANYREILFFYMVSADLRS